LIPDRSARISPGTTCSPIRGGGQDIVGLLTFDLLVWPWQLPDAMRVAAENPGVVVVVEHLGLPDLTRPDGLEVWRQGIRAVGRRARTPF
jgi:predicted TIM-barrel fold metal-dependent hydrolase